MSRAHFPRLKGWIGRTAGQRLRAVRQWPLWLQPLHVLGVLFVVEALAVVLTAVTITRFPVYHKEWVIAAVLAVGSIVHLEAARGIERVRDVLRADGPHIDLKSVWTFAAVLLLPPPLAVGMVILTWAHLRLRVVKTPIFRWAYSMATVVLATHVASAVLQVGLPQGQYPGLPVGWQGLGVLVLAGLTRWFINFGLVTIIILVSSPQTPGRTALGSAGGHAVELAGVSLGGATALVVATDPWYMLLILP